MLRFASLLLIFIASCSTGREVGASHHPDLTLIGLATSAEGDSQLFRNYRADGPVLWSQGWTWKLDLSGIAWDKSNTATVITPRHVVMAAHYTRKVGDTLVFHDRTGKRHARVLKQMVKFGDRKIAGDVAIGLLDQPLPPAIRAYALPKPRSDGGASLVGAVALVTEQQRKLFFHQIGMVHSNYLYFRFDPRIDSSRRKNLIAGDSGHPSFLLSKGELVLIETHTGGGAGSGPFYGSKDVQDAMRDIMRELDSSYTFRTVEIDDRTLAEAGKGRDAMPKPAAPPAQPVVRPPATQPQRDSARKPRPRVVRPPEH